MYGVLPVLSHEETMTKGTKEIAQFLCPRVNGGWQMTWEQAYIAVQGRVQGRRAWDPPQYRPEPTTEGSPSQPNDSPPAASA